MRAAVVILNYNGASMLTRFLPSVLKYSADAEIVVADNASTDNSVAVMKEQFPAVRLVQLDRNYGFAEGYNRALKQIEAEYYLLLNSDVEVSEGWLQPLLAFMDSHPDAVACQPKLLACDRKTHFEYAGASGGFIDRYGYPYCRGRLFGTVEEDKGQYDDACRIFWATGAAMMVRSSAYWGAGGLDGRFFAHMEEVDLCWRMQARGGCVYVVPQSKVYHVGGATLNKANPHKTFLNFRNNLLMLYKNLPERELRPVLLVRALLDYVAAAMFLLKGEWGSVKAVFRARRAYRKLKGEFRTSREENLRKAVSMDVPERTHFSILWRYHVARAKTFDKL